VRILSPEEIGRVTEAVTPRWHPLLIAASHTAARISELLGLQWEDIDWDENTLSISKQLGRDGKLARTKNGKVRTISMSAELRLVLRELYVASGQRSGFVFASETGLAPSYANARRALERAIRDPGSRTTTRRIA
jgi:integrase